MSESEREREREREKRKEKKCGLGKKIKSKFSQPVVVSAVVMSRAIVPMNKYQWPSARK